MECLSLDDSDEETPIEFHFSNLPAELRFKIWNFALIPHEPDRLIRVKARPVVCDPEFGLYYDFQVNSDQQNSYARTSSSVLQVALLRVCKESRQVYFETYKLTYSLPCGLGRKVWCSDETIVYIENEDLGGASRRDGVRNAFIIGSKYRLPKWFTEIKQLALPAGIFEDDTFTHFDDFVYAFVRAFKGLDRLHLALWDDKNWYPWLEAREVGDFFKNDLIPKLEGVLDNLTADMDKAYHRPEIKLLEDGAWA